MSCQFTRRGFIKASLLASSTIPLSLAAQPGANPTAAETQTSRTAPLPAGRIAGQEISRLILGGNLIGGHAHARDLGYVGSLMRRYNTPAKVRETLELAEAEGITAMNSWVQDDNTAIFAHWKNGGKMKWIAQARLDGGGGFSQLQRAIDEGATAVHLTGDTCESLIARGEFGKVGESIEFIKARKRIAGVAAHDLQVVIECEKAKLPVDFFVKTFHSHDYFTAPKTGEKDALGKNDNSWCADPQAVVDFMATVQKPWIAFKILAAGAIHPRMGFPHAFNGGADFILVGMFDWQVAENAKLARRIVTLMTGDGPKRARPWCA